VLSLAGCNISHDGFEVNSHLLSVNHNTRDPVGDSNQNDPPLATPIPTPSPNPSIGYCDKPGLVFCEDWEAGKWTNWIDYNAGDSLNNGGYRGGITCADGS